MKKWIFLPLLLSSALFAKDIYATFDVEADKSAELAFNASGIVQKIYVDVGSQVKQGDVLAQLDAKELQASLDIAKSKLEAAKITLEYAQRDYQRQEKIKNLIDEALFDKFNLALKKAKTAVAEAQADVEYKQAILDNTSLKAPFDGVITSKKIEAGDVVNSMMLKTAFGIQSQSKRKLVLSFDQTYWKEVKKGDEFTYKIDGDTTKHEGKITKIYPAANVENRKLKAEVLAKDFIVGLFGDGTIHTSEK